jgi:hypothetical protein
MIKSFHDLFSWIYDIRMYKNRAVFMELKDISVQLQLKTIFLTREML